MIYRLQPLRIAPTLRIAWLQDLGRFDLGAEGGPPFLE